MMKCVATFKENGVEKIYTCSIEAFNRVMHCFSKHSVIDPDTFNQVVKAISMMNTINKGEHILKKKYTYKDLIDSYYRYKCGEHDYPYAKMENAGMKRAFLSIERLILKDFKTIPFKKEGK